MEAPKGSLEWLEIIQSVRYRELDCELQLERAGTKESGSDRWFRKEKGHRSTDKSYPGDNRLISPKSSHRQGRFATRCRLVASEGCSRSKGWAVRPLKRHASWVQERRGAVPVLSRSRGRRGREICSSLRGPEWTYR